MTDCSFSVQGLYSPPVGFGSANDPSLLKHYLFNFYIDDKHFVSELDVPFVNHLMQIFNVDKPDDLGVHLLKLTSSLDGRQFKFLVPNGSIVLDPNVIVEQPEGSDDTFYIIKVIKIVTTDLD